MKHNNTWGEPPHEDKPANSYQPSAVSHQPTANSYQPSAVSHQPTANSQPPTANRQWPTANSQSPTASRRPPIIAIANQKGGVGKTTTCVHLAAYLAGQGRRVIVADADPQGNATAWLCDEAPDESALWRLLIARDQPAQVLHMARWGVGLLPGSDETGDALITLTALRRPFDAIAQALQAVAACFQPDYLLLDMPPSKAAGFRELLYAADYLLVPTQVERLSLNGVQFMAATLHELRQTFGHGPRLLGIVPTMVRARTVDHGDHLTDLVGHFGPAVWPAVPLSIKVSEACTYGTTVWARDNRCEAALGMRAVCERFVENLGGGD
jgi:chromosome partitioning protein